ncbi:neutral zinc metallopeptidase [Agreia sp. COWG]|uniref:KPN_02809 family neutral zinc metallopeptidase n=1 Tax=Agreia sp. COWG TaxID=2773266 RepID=UPI0019262742|nr:neutral zinc metallopeptidase [Agreia sp. COWG]CAD6006192.1 Neutral zinc metallopeptidase [Agreia sp. COWG]
MTFNDNAKLDTSRVSKRGRSRGIAVGGGSAVVVVGLFLLSQLLGVDLTGLAGLVGGGTAGQAQQGEVTSLQCDTGADANANLDCLMVGTENSLDAYWRAEAPALGISYAPVTKLNLFTAATNTGCGQASSATGPFYCPTDSSIYVDTAFFDELRSQFGASGGTLSEMYVVAHEFGHHIQNLAGVMDNTDRSGTGPTSDSVRTELQADCYAGAWVAAASTTEDTDGVAFLQPVTDAQLADALNAASVIGDDRIQQRGSGEVNPETWTHGSSSQREKWFQAGMTNGAGGCDTFSLDGSQL